MARILVIGGTGFIGPHVVSALSRMGHAVTVFHRGEHEAALTPLPPEVRHVHSPSAGFPVMDFPRELQHPAPQVVLHMVAMGEHDALAAVAAFSGIAERLVAVSSGDVYRAYGVLRRLEAAPQDPAALARPLTPSLSPSLNPSLNEDAPLRAQLYPYRGAAKGPDDWIYHYDKILVERVVMGAPRLPGTVLRLPVVYGPGDGHRLFPYLKRMDDRRPAILLDEEHARWRWSHGFVENVAAAIVLAVTDGRAAGRIYNVAEKTAAPTTQEWIATIGRVARWDGQVVSMPRQRLPAHLRQDYNYSQDLVMDAGRLRADLGHEDRVARDEALRRTIAWERANPPAQFDAEQFDYEAEDAALALL